MTATEKRVCRTCFYVKLSGSGFYKGDGATCGNYRADRVGGLVTPDKTTCDRHATPVEARAYSIIYTSVDDAKTRVADADLAVLRLAKLIETKGASRTSLLKMIDARIRKLERLNHERPQTAAA